MSKKLKLYIKHGESISLKEDQKFYKKFPEKLLSDALSLYKEIWKDWKKNINSEKGNCKIVTLPDSRCLPRKKPKGGKGGVYSIYGIKQDDIECYYVGISISDVRARLRTHLDLDIRKNYRDVFNKIKNYEELYIFYNLLDSDYNKNYIKTILELIESCLTIILQPKFLSLANSKDA